MINTNKLSNLQLELLQLFSTNVNDKDLINIRNILSDYFLNLAENDIAQISEKMNYSSETFKQWAEEHNRSAL